MANFDFVREPLDNLDNLIAEAQTLGVPEPTAMSIATINKRGRPTARLVLYKGRIRGLPSFFTNYDSAKGHDLEHNQYIAATFFWGALAQQVRIEGLALKVSRSESEAYFKTRPRLSQEGAWASRQSETVPSLDYLKDKLLKIQGEFEGKDVPCPPNWGGYLIVPDRFEFWFGRQGRFHERYLYSCSGGVIGVPGYFANKPGTAEALYKNISWKRSILSP